MVRVASDGYRTLGRPTTVLADDDMQGAGPRALVVWWDLGAGSSAGDLSRAQQLVTDVIDAAALAVWCEQQHNPDGVLRQHRGRYYLRDRTPWLGVLPARTDIRPNVAAAGYTNPWFEVLREGANALEAYAGVGLAALVLAKVDSLLSAVKELATLRGRILAENSTLRAQGLEANVASERALRELDSLRDYVERAEAVNTSIVASEADRTDSAQGELAVLISDDDEPLERDAVESWRPRHPSRPSVSDAMGAEEATLALVSDRVVVSVARLLEAVGAGEGTLETEFLEAREALERLALVATVQRQLSKYALGDLTVEEFRAAVGASPDAQADPLGGAAPPLRRDDGSLLGHSAVPPAPPGVTREQDQLS